MDKKIEAVRLRVEGATQQQIGDALGVSRQRVPQLLAEALASGEFVAKVQIVRTQGVDALVLAAFLRQQLNDAGIRLAP